MYVEFLASRPRIFMKFHDFINAIKEMKRTLRFIPSIKRSNKYRNLLSDERRLESKSSIILTLSRDWQRVFGRGG